MVWITRLESPPSKCSHTMPDAGHQLTNSCWCRPSLIHTDNGARTMVVHKTATEAPDENWPFREQRL